MNRNKFARKFSPKVPLSEEICAQIFYRSVVIGLPSYLFCLSKHTLSRHIGKPNNKKNGLCGLMMDLGLRFGLISPHFSIGGRMKKKTLKKVAISYNYHYLCTMKRKIMEAYYADKQSSNK